VHLQRRYTKEAIVALWIVMILATGTTHQALVLNVLFGAFYYLYLAYSQ